MARQQIKDARKHQLMQAAIDSIAKRGLAETTITHISEGAGMSRGIVNFYFTSKEQMLRSTLEYILAQSQAAWQSAADAPAASADARLKALLAALLGKKICQAKRLNVLVAFWAHAATHKHYRDMVLRHNHALLQTLSECLEPVLGDARKAAAVAPELYAVLQGYWMEYLLSPDQVDRSALLARCTRWVEQQRSGSATIIAAEFGKPAAKGKKQKPREVLEGQLDIEDLFNTGSR